MHNLIPKYTWKKVIVCIHLLYNGSKQFYCLSIYAIYSQIQNLDLCMRFSAQPPDRLSMRVVGLRALHHLPRVPLPYDRLERLHGVLSRVDLPAALSLCLMTRYCADLSERGTHQYLINLRNS
jgi:hypothetical protein